MLIFWSLRKQIFANWLNQRFNKCAKVKLKHFNPTWSLTSFNIVRNRKKCTQILGLCVSGTQHANSQDFRIVLLQYMCLFFFLHFTFTCRSHPVVEVLWTKESNNTLQCWIWFLCDRSETQYESRSCLLKKTLTFIYYFFVTSDLFHSFLFSLVNLLTVSVWLSFFFVLLARFRLLLCFFPTTSIFGGPLYCFFYSLRFFVCLFIFVDCRCNPS